MSRKGDVNSFYDGTEVQLECVDLTLFQAQFFWQGKTIVLSRIEGLNPICEYLAPTNRSVVN